MRTRIGASAGPRDDDGTTRTAPGPERRSWKPFALGGVAWTILYFASNNPAVQDVMYPLTGLFAGLAILFGIRRNRPESKSAWVLFATGLFLWTIGDSIWSCYELVLHEVAPWPSAADAIYLVGTSFLVLGLIRMLRQRFPGGDIDGVVDAVIIAVGVGTLSWAFLISPYATDPGLGTMAKVVSTLYPVSDILLLAIVARLFLGPGARSTSHRLLAGGLVLLLVSDSVYSVQGLNGSYYTGHLVDGGWILFYLLVGAAALHRSIAADTTSVLGDVHKPSRTRLALLIAAASMAPLTMLVQRERGVSVDVPLIAGASLVVFILVVFRMERLLRTVAGKNAQLQSQGTLLRSSLDDRTKLESRLRHQALHDPLTSLPNRVLFRDRLDQALQHMSRSNGTLGLLFIDLDDFKIVNDTLGHEAGDLYLVEAAERLRRMIRTSDTAVRLSGDEFALLLEQTTGRAAAAMVAGRVLTAMRQPFILSGRVIPMPVSIGIAWTDDPSTTSLEMQRQADIAMYSAKHHGKDRYVVFEPSMQKEAIGSQRRRADLPKALERDQLRAVYQPIVDLASGRITGAEALVRWQHPVDGLVSPAEFLPQAEEAGIIFDLDMWMLEQACTQLAAWRGLSSNPTFGINVNLSAGSLQHDDLVDRVTSILSATRTDPTNVVMELTETLLVGDVEATASRLRELKAHGLRIAIDDFGTGYSSLAYLRCFPIDILKIDKSFVDGAALGSKDSSFAGTIIALADQLQLSTVAEGVEDHDQVTALLDMGASSAQGFYFSRPVDAAVMKGLISGEAALPRKRDPVITVPPAAATAAGMACADEERFRPGRSDHLLEFAGQGLSRRDSEPV